MFSNPAFMPARPSVIGGQRPDVPTQPVTLPLTVQESDPSVVRSSAGWTNEVHPAYFPANEPGATGAYNIQNGAYAEVTLLGTGLRYESYANTSGSIIGVFRNGAQVDSFDSNRTSAGRYVLYTITGWNPGDVVRFQKLSGTAITIDQFTHINGDADAEAYIKAANITDQTQQSAVATFVKSLKQDGLWSKLDAIYPFVGGTSTAHAVNLKAPGISSLTFFGSPVHSATGVAFDGVSQYADTGIPDNAFPTDDFGMTYYSRSNTSGGYMEMGNYPYSYLCINYQGILYIGMHSVGDVNGGPGYPDTRGAFSYQRINDTTLELYRNGIFTRSVASPSIMPNSSPHKIGGTYNSSFYTNRECAFAAFHRSFTAIEMSNYYAAIQALQTALGRAV